MGSDFRPHGCDPMGSAVGITPIYPRGEPPIQKPWPGNLCGSLFIPAAIGAVGDLQVTGPNVVAIAAGYITAARF